jgi:peptidyl-tRNA hydrolase, PTH1 family
MKVVVGLGNPGVDYDGTRHNIGFEVLDKIAKTESDGRFALKFHGAVSQVSKGEEKILLVKPMTFMNLSGSCVSEILGFYRVEPVDLIVLCDDVNLPLGKIRVRSEGGHGGHNGLRDIQAKLGSTSYPRIRLGVGGPGESNLSGFVLGKFRSNEFSEAKMMIDDAIDAVWCWVRDGIHVCMNRFNGPVK